MSLLKVDDIQDLSANKYGRVVQSVNFQTGEFSSGTTLMILDDTIPQIDEGDEYITLNITPRNLDNKLLIEVFFIGSVSSGFACWALFQDSTADALASVFKQPVSVNEGLTCSLRHFMTAGTASPTTFRLRFGGVNAGTTFFNNEGNNPVYAGTVPSSITITELRV